ncbi:MAG TPA: bifunctional diaminohydroxyphosphoribosylaminopyrimidine deaminase/5-amino-6-(5-phosphoribosylamino)uracil reductase RibD [Verrucomicrobiae bacterium]|nr:bifunctional diaminohydroxyphosphoribosylaminopyrimidine deaminase/5-amino-6-(5-phosphoribosylamino)uracil reductase RibD [Verrucomicrobiae bacterium]
MGSGTEYMRQALQLARRGFGCTSPNPMVGAVLVRGGKVIGQGWHHRAGLPHAEIEALNNARRRGHQVRGSSLYVTLEPCSTFGRTPPCTNAIISAGIRKVFVGAIDPNPRHAGRGLVLLQRAGISVERGLLEEECEQLNEAFNYWVKRGMPFVTVKAAMTLDGKIATRSGESKWITGTAARAWSMRLRQGVDAILVGINTVLADDPSLTVRIPGASKRGQDRKTPRRVVLDSMARTPVDSKLVQDSDSAATTVVVSRAAPRVRRRALASRVQVLVAPGRSERIDVEWLLRKLGADGVTSLLVEGGGEVNASFLLGGFAQRVAFFYAPKILGGADALKAVAGKGARSLNEALQLLDVQWRRLGSDWLLTACVRSEKGVQRKR